MSKDDKSRKPLVSTWEYMRHQVMKAIGGTIGTLLKLGGVLAIICGLLGIALANMDVNPTASIVSGVLLTCLGLVMLYFGSKIATKAKTA